MYNSHEKLQLKGTEVLRYKFPLVSFLIKFRYFTNCKFCLNTEVENTNLRVINTTKDNSCHDFRLLDIQLLSYPSTGNLQCQNKKFRLLTELNFLTILHYL